MVKNSLWPKNSICTRARREDAEEASKGQVTKGLVCHAKEPGFYLEVDGKPFEKFKQGSNMLRFTIQKDQSFVSLKDWQRIRLKAKRPVKILQESRQEITRT